MAWTYDETDLGTTTSSGRLNSVRFLVGDTDFEDPLVQNEEIAFALSQTGNNIYRASIFVCRTLLAKFARMVTTQHDGVLEAWYSDRIKHYTTLITQLENMQRNVGGSGLGVFAGGIKEVEVEQAENDEERVQPDFRKGQFNYWGRKYIPDYE